MKLTFIGCGSAFTTQEYYQSNLLINKNGKNFLIDIGSDARFSLAELNLKATDIDAFTLTHAHADHCGGVEWLAFSTYFIPNRPHPKLYGVDELLDEIWENTLSGGLGYVDGLTPRLNTFFDVTSITRDDFFIWENIKFQPFRTIHVKSRYKIAPSFGYVITDLDSGYKVLYTGDTRLTPKLISQYESVDLILNECETSQFPSNVHCNYNDLVKVDVEYKSKMWLYHYQPNPTQNPTKDGFIGFVVKGQTVVDTNEDM